MFTVGTSLEGKGFMIESAAVADTKKGTKYLKITFRDKQHSISGNLWDYSESLHGFIKVGSVVKVCGSVEEYNGAPQLKLGKVEPSSEPVMNFARSTQLDVEEMWAHLVTVVDETADPMAKYILEELVLKAMAEAFKKAPAARGVHSAYFGGLLEHVWSMVRMAKPIVAHYNASFDAKISADKVMFGLIAHDVAKIIEYDFSTPAFATTPIGILTNHLVVGPIWVNEFANKWKLTPAGQAMGVEEFKMARAELIHTVSSHHGQKEWGSPTEPSTLEAILVHQIDLIDSRMMHALEMIQNKPGQVPGFTEKSYIAGVMFKR